MYENTEFTLSRDCEAIQIPSGQKTTIPAGTQGVITQSLGGSYTIATYQGLARVAEKDLEALGLEKPQPQQTQKSAPANGEVSEEDVWNQLRQCYDPEIPVNIVDLGLVYDCRLIKKEDAQERERQTHENAITYLASIHRLEFTRFLIIRTTGKLNPFTSGTS